MLKMNMRTEHLEKYLLNRNLIESSKWGAYSFYLSVRANFKLRYTSLLILLFSYSGGPTNKDCLTTFES